MTRMTTRAGGGFPVGVLDQILDSVPARSAVRPGPAAGGHRVDGRSAVHHRQADGSIGDSLAQAENHAGTLILIMDINISKVKDTFWTPTQR